MKTLEINTLLKKTSPLQTCVYGGLCQKQITQIIKRTFGNTDPVSASVIRANTSRLRRNLIFRSMWFSKYFSWQNKSKCSFSIICTNLLWAVNAFRDVNPLLSVVLLSWCPGVSCTTWLLLIEIVWQLGHSWVMFLFKLCKGTSWSVMKPDFRWG
jgi:hypothetical protein